MQETKMRRPNHVYPNGIYVRELDGRLKVYAGTKPEKKPLRKRYNLLTVERQQSYRRYLKKLCDWAEQRPKIHISCYERNARKGNGKAK